MKSRLEVYARLKPGSSRAGGSTYHINPEAKQMQLQIPKNIKFGHVNNSRDVMDFNFNQIFDQDANQEDIFDKVGKPVVLNCLEGYNGTIFAYGQTGSGKTHTMSGAESWQLRGIIPRVLSCIFDEFENRPDVEYNMYVSFMEIYNETAYDLLDRKHIEQSMESWNKVQLMEDDYGNIHLKNLSVHQCYNEQDGIDLLMMGNFIRQVSSTPLNQSSSRSHCIFTIALEGKHQESDSYFVSKLHLVDLAGSERISKTQVEGSILTEAKHINLSLTYLEQVIIALHEKGLGNRSHIPYRNSLMTTILKDSLGGNCKTVMVATLSSDLDNLEETISTARFAQRCSQLVNEIKKNEKIDLNILVKKLEFENLQLTQELEYYKMHFGDKQLPQKMIKDDSGKKVKTRGSKKEDEEERKLTQMEYFEINGNVENYLNEKVEKLTVKDTTDSQAYFRAMRDVYHSRMREYITELNAISIKLKKYEDILSKNKKNPKSLGDSRELSSDDINPLQKSIRSNASGIKDSSNTYTKDDVRNQSFTNNQSNGMINNAQNTVYVQSGNRYDSENTMQPPRNYNKEVDNNGYINSNTTKNKKPAGEVIKRKAVVNNNQFLAKLTTDQPIPESGNEHME